MSSIVASTSTMCMALCSAGSSSPADEGQPTRIVGLLGDRRRHRLALLPPAQAAELRIERQHVRQRRRAGAGQADDVDRAADRDVVDLGVLGVPRLDLEPVDEAAPQVADTAASVYG